MGRILAIVDLAGPAADDTAFELAAAARALGGSPVTALAAGHGLDAVGADLARHFDEVVLFDDERFAAPDGDLLARAAAGLMERLAPSVTLAAHTNLGLDFAPGLAARGGMTFVADCLSLEAADGGFTAVRTVYGGKIHERVRVVPGAGGVLATLRPGAFAAHAAPDGGGSVERVDVPADLAPRRRLLETVSPEAGAVDITQSEFLVAVGRGIEDEENLEMIESLAAALGADVACTRPVVDKGWMEKNRQVGTSGMTVKPKVYVTVGVSGSFQHMGGVKGGPFIAAINKDAAAPIFGVADVGIVGDLFDLVPLLEAKLRERKA